ncbi:MAG: nucleotide-binding protein [Chloroflexi bacterium]|nr:nucleotide-binding protein [Chloroflexota bacterium]
MPYPFHILNNKKLLASSHDVETFIRHALGQQFFIIEKICLDETKIRYHLQLWKRDVALDRYMLDDKIGKVYWGGIEIIEWSDSTEIVRMWVATPEDWYIGEFTLDKDKEMEKRFEQLEKLSNEILGHFTQPANENQVEVSKKMEMSMSNSSEQNSNDTKRNVFVVHGRNESLRRSIFDLLRAIGLNPIEWTKAIAMTGKGAPYIGDVLDKAMEQAQAIVVLFTGDDEAKLKDEFQNEHDPDYEKHLTSQARPNVLFEAGMAFGKYPERTILIQIGSIRPFSDIAGRHIIHLTNSVQARQELASRLETAGCSVDLKGTDWHSAGKFSIPRDKKVHKKEASLKHDIKQSVSLVEKVAKENNMPVGAINILIALTYVPRSMDGQVLVDVLAQATGINPLRAKKDCELLESIGFAKKGNVRFEEIYYHITDRGKIFLLETGLV